MQVKRTRLPLRFSRSAWQRMQADARRLGWQWVIAATGDDHRPRWLDPHRARHGREVRLGQDATIDNLLLWLERPRAAAGQARP